MKRRIGIILPHQHGDLLTATGALYYREELWPNSDIIWFCNDSHKDLLKYQDVELRNFPHGWEIPQNDLIYKYADRIKKDKEDGLPDWEDLSLAKNQYNKLNQEIKHKFNSLKDLDEAYYPAPWMLTMAQRHGFQYPNISKRIFEIPMKYEWHPVLSFSEQERIDAKEFIEGMTYLNKTVVIESFCGSGQSLLNDTMVRETMRVCREVFGVCNFVFVSHKYLNGNEIFPEDLKNEQGVYFASHFTVRQCALIIKECDLLISTSSGVTVAASCWENKDARFKTLQYTGSLMCSTIALREKDFELITYDDLPLHIAENNYYAALNKLLNQIK